MLPIDPNYTLLPPETLQLLWGSISNFFQDNILVVIGMVFLGVAISFVVSWFWDVAMFIDNSPHRLSGRKSLRTSYNRWRGRNGSQL